LTSGTGYGMTIAEAVKRYGEILKLKLVKVSDAPIGTGVTILPPSTRLGDGVYRIELGAEAEPATGLLVPVALLGNRSSALAAYGTVLTYTPPAATAKIFYLKEISISNNNSAVGLWRVTVNGVQQFTGLLTGSHAWRFAGRGIPLLPGQIVLIESASDGATTVLSMASITGETEA
jgi:hypothetical protein